jgi:DNA repair photolyase
MKIEIDDEEIYYVIYKAINEVVIEVVEKYVKHALDKDKAFKELLKKRSIDVSDRYVQEAIETFKSIVDSNKRKIVKSIVLPEYEEEKNINE